MKASIRPDDYIVTYRGPIIENRHLVHAAIVDANGNLLYSVGDPSRVTLMRSAAKPAQALAILETGCFEQCGFDDADLALMCASHSSEDRHIARARAMLAKSAAAAANTNTSSGGGGQTPQETDLRCGGHPAISETVNKAWIKAGYTPTGICSNCSGKHVGMMAGARALLLGRDARKNNNDDDLSDYHLPSNQMQIQVRRVVEELCDLPEEGVQWGIDGCNLPAPAVPLRSMARMYATIAAAVDDDDRQQQQQDEKNARSQRLARIYRAMCQHPDLIAGQDRFCTRLMTAYRGGLIGKLGAEGCYGIAIRATTTTIAMTAYPDIRGKIGIAVKIEDGNIPILYAAVMEILEQLGIGTQEMREQLADFHHPRLLNTAGVEIGHVSCAFKLRVT